MPSVYAYSPVVTLPDIRVRATLVEECERLQGVVGRLL